MKINWGTGIVIAFILFMAFILYFVIKVQTDPQYDNQLVTTDYYKQEAHVQDNINKEVNANNLSEKVIITKIDDGIEIKFPNSFEANNISGNVSFYRPSNQRLDFEIPISLSNSHLLIPKKSLVSGLWDITVDWKYKDTEYRNKKTIYF